MEAQALVLIGLMSAAGFGTLATIRFCQWVAHRRHCGAVLRGEVKCHADHLHRNRKPNLKGDLT